MLLLYQISPQRNHEQNTQQATQHRQSGHLKIDGFNPHKKSAGKAKITPEANDELAEPMVCDILLSRTMGLPVIRRISRNKPTVITATGIEVETVIPTSKPR